MAQPDIKADKINSPIQLMAAWFVMLILISGVLLGAAASIEKPDWAAGYLVFFTTVIIVAVITLVFLMLTKFRPNLQDGKEYAEWLKEQGQYSDGLVKEQPAGGQNRLIKQKLEQIKQSTIDKKAIPVIDKLEDSILYSASVLDMKGAELIINELSEIGIESTIYESRDGEKESLFENCSIWLGSNIPANIAIPIIQKAVKIWPQLKYIAFPSDNAPEDTQWSVFIGGASKTSEKRGYKPWTTEEISSLTVTDTESFHKKVRAKYP